MAGKGFTPPLWGFLAGGEKVFVPVVIRAIRQRRGLTQREAGLVFSAGGRAFENTRVEKFNLPRRRSACSGWR